MKAQEQISKMIADIVATTGELPTSIIISPDMRDEMYMTAADELKIADDGTALVYHGVKLRANLG